MGDDFKELLQRRNEALSEGGKKFDDYCEDHLSDARQQLAAMTAERDAAIGHAASMSNDVTHLGEQLAKAQARVVNLEKALMADDFPHKHLIETRRCYHERNHIIRQRDATIATLQATLAERERQMRETLKQHWVTAVDCNHEEKKDTVRCSCSVWTGTPKSSVGQAIDEWIDHVVDRAQRAMRGE